MYRLILFTTFLLNLMETKDHVDSPTVSPETAMALCTISSKMCLVVWLKMTHAMILPVILSSDIPW